MIRRRARWFAAAWAVGCALAGEAGATVRMDVLAGTWRDDFTDLSGIVSNRQGMMAAPSGFTIDGGVQTLTWPFSTTGYSEPFTAPGSSVDATLTVGNAGSSAEYLTLWNARYDPGRQLDVANDCAGWTGETCDGAKNMFQNGDSVDYYIRNAPYEGSNWLPAAGWDTENNKGFAAALGMNIQYFFCRQPKSATDATPNPPTISTFLGAPLMDGLRLRSLVPNRGYTATFLAGTLLGLHSAHSGTAYLMFEIYDRTTKGAAASATLFENQFFSGSIPAKAGGATPGPEGMDYRQMTSVSVHLDPARNLAGHSLDLRVLHRLPPRETGTDWGCSHCTMLGPIWLTADEGMYSSPLFDTLSVATRWLDICWKADMSTTYIDSAVSAIPPGAPLTPVRLSYSVSNTAGAALPVSFTVTHGGEVLAGNIGTNMIVNSCNSIHDAAGAAMTGRYFQWSAQLLGRTTASWLDPDLAPAPPTFFFGALRPLLREVMVHYYVCAAQAVSRRIAPTSVRRWGQIDYVVEKPSPAATIRVDVLASDGTVLMADVATGTSLASVDPYRNPSLVLRAVLESDPADCAKRPILRAWQVRWDPLVDILELTCNSVRPALGEECRMQVRVDRAGPVRVEVHDAAGQSVRVLVDAELPAEAHLTSWNGRNGAGDIVAGGVYFVVARVPGGRRVRKLAVMR